MPLGQYVADVTPSESPASWGALGGGEGLQELEAQAVAVRSYVMSTYGSLQGYFGYADICDSTACQDYPGIANENATTDTAVTATANTAVLMPGGHGGEHPVLVVDGRVQRGRDLRGGPRPRRLGVRPRRLQLAPHLAGPGARVRHRRRLPPDRDPGVGRGVAAQQPR